MSCKHAEDVCQDCLEKVQTTTEEAPPTKRSPSEKKHSPPPEKTMTRREKRNNILIDSAILAAFGALAYFNTKLLLKNSVELFHIISGNIDTLLDTIGTRTRKE